MAENLAAYLIALFSEERSYRPLVRQLIHIEKKQHIYDKIQTSRILVDYSIFGEDVTFNLNVTFKSKEPNYDKKYDFSNIKTLSKLAFSLSFSYLKSFFKFPIFYFFSKFAILVRIKSKYY